MYKQIVISYCTQRNNFKHFLDLPNMKLPNECYRWMAIGYLMEKEYEGKGRYFKLNSIPIVLDMQEEVE